MLDLMAGRMVVMVMTMTMARSEDRSREDHHQQCSGENLFHGLNPSTD